MAAERIVSFLPSATDMIYRLGAQDRLYGITHECSTPAGHEPKPVVISSGIDPGISDSAEIHDAVARCTSESREVFCINKEALRDADPDIIIAQDTCAVCAADRRHLDAALEILGGRPEVLALDPHTMDEILDCMMDIALAIGEEARGKDIIESVRGRIRDISRTRRKNRPSLFAIEWIKPLFLAGHWVPEMIHAAGGTNLMGEPGAHSQRITMRDIIDADADIIVLMPCGMNAYEARREYARHLESSQEWRFLRAARNGRVYAADGGAYFSRPGINIAEGVEILSEIIHPGSSGKPGLIQDGSFFRL